MLNQYENTTWFLRSNAATSQRSASRLCKRSTFWMTQFSLTIYCCAREVTRVIMDTKIVVFTYLLTYFVQSVDRLNKGLSTSERWTRPWVEGHVKHGRRILLTRELDLQGIMHSILTYVSRRQRTTVAIPQEGRRDSGATQRTQTWHGKRAMYRSAICLTVGLLQVFRCMWDIQINEPEMVTK